MISLMMKNKSDDEKRGWTKMLMVLGLNSEVLAAMALYYDV